MRKPTGLLLVRCLLCCLAAMLWAGRCPAVEFGICPPTYYPGQGVLFTQDAASDVQRLGAGWIRVPFADENGSLNFTAYDEILARAHSHGLKVLGVVLLDPGSWDRESSQFRQAFIARCQALATRYSSTVDAWELWNEPEQTSAYISPESFALLVIDGSEAIKAIDPNAVVMPGGMASPLPYLQQFYSSSALTTYRSAHGRSPFDAVAVHPYNYSSDPKYYLAGYLAAVRSVMAAYGDAGKPIWITEVGWNTAASQGDSVGGDAAPFGWNDQAQALNIRDLYAAAVGIPSLGPIFTYALSDYALPSSLGWFGLRRYDLSPKASWFAYRDAAHGSPGSAQLANGGFETGNPSDWTAFGTLDGVTGGPWFAGITPRSGRYFLGSAVNMPGAAGGKNGGVMQRVTVTPGAEYQLSASVRTYQDGGTTTDAACRVGIDPAGGQDSASPAIAWSEYVSSEGGWASVYVDATPVAGTITVFVQFRQNAPVWDVTAADDVMLRERVIGTPMELKRLPDGALVRTGGLVVVAAGLNGPSFYAEAPDRSSAIRVISDASVEAGDVVGVEGQMGMNASERVLNAASVAIIGSQTLSPLLIGGRDMGGGPVIGMDGEWKAQDSDGAGLSNMGLLVTTWGHVSYVDPAGAFFYVDDGTGRRDGSGTGSGVRVIGASSSALGHLTRVTGVVSCFTSGGRVSPQIVACTTVPLDSFSVVLQPH